MGTIVPFILMVLGTLGPVCATAQQTDRAASAASAAGVALVDRLRQGGAVMFIRHADTAGQPCDAYGSARKRQRYISAAGRDQAAALGRRIAALGIPVAQPILTGPVFRARDTAELAFGADRVRPLAALGNRRSLLMANSSRR